MSNFSFHCGAENNAVAAVVAIAEAAASTASARNDNRRTVVIRQFWATSFPNSFVDFRIASSKLLHNF